MEVKKVREIDYDGVKSLSDIVDGEILVNDGKERVILKIRSGNLMIVRTVKRVKEGIQFNRYYYNSRGEVEMGYSININPEDKSSREVYDKLDQFLIEGGII